LGIFVYNFVFDIINMFKVFKDAIRHIVN
jgi:hypothetical protein